MREVTYIFTYTKISNILANSDFFTKCLSMSQTSQPKKYFKIYAVEKILEAYLVIPYVKFIQVKIQVKYLNISTFQPTPIFFKNNVWSLKMVSQKEIQFYE